MTGSYVPWGPLEPWAPPPLAVEEQRAPPQAYAARFMFPHWCPSKVDNGEPSDRLLSGRRCGTRSVFKLTEACWFNFETRLQSYQHSIYETLPPRFTEPNKPMNISVTRCPQNDGFT